METRKIPGTDLNLSVIAFGSYASGKGWAPSERKSAIEAIRASYQLGVTTFDTAPIYGLGDTEAILGEALSCFPRDKVQILTKFGLRWLYVRGRPFRTVVSFDGKDVNIYRYATRESVIEECENSLRRLKTDYIDLYQLHWPDEATPFEETFEAVSRLVEQGKVRYVGVSNVTPEQMDEIGKIVPVASLQMPYNMVERGIEKDVMKYCIDSNRAILAYRPLEAGLLTGKIRPDATWPRNDSRNTNPYFTPDNIRRVNAFLEQLRPLASEKKATLAQLALRWTANRPGITSVLAGAVNSLEAVENARAAEISLSRRDMDFINGTLLKLDTEMINEALRKTRVRLAALS
ncbi:aldo/keto reductase [Oxalobacter aliiformigenes]|uniref:aldo/keto reductase n=1 Tax=Oxalobacter aliiformigenes TaxID=2946593 RepID=UPI0022AF11CA|nr:aldo/keto reductase [Oxalobacter aliiformigenes]MCZ4065174.1 aldo/keto reductase [Oxalobacter aliiformigenes]WAV98280.1 aldo/keto reductase [Oxalobacter aliiformigenes]